uniref:Gag-pol polyprotein n=1 Tax=Quercus lobata TaxID=97700 RepID=A0A7N2L7E5_QUELO
MIVITESKDVDPIPIDELVGSFQSYESDLPKTNKSKSMALKTIDDVEDYGFDDELSSTKIAYLAKNFRNFLRNNNRRARNRNTADSKNVKKNDIAKNNNAQKSKDRESKGKAMAATLSDDEVFDHESESDQEGNFMAFTAIVEGAYNKLCKIVAKDAMSVELGLKKINTPEQEKKNFLLKLFDANELLNSVKIENMSLLEKVKSLELKLSISREQIDRTSTSKLDEMLHVQKSVSDQTSLGFVKNGSTIVVNTPKFVPATSSSVVRQTLSNVKFHNVVSPASRRTRVDLSVSESKNSNQSGSKENHKP